MVQNDRPVGLDGVQVRFDDERVVSDAGVMLVATLAQRLGIEALAGRLVGLRRDRPGAANAARKVMALLYAMALGADSIDDADVVRAGKALYIGVSEWTAEQIRAGHALSEQLGFQLISSQPQYSMLWRVIEDEVVPTSRELGVSQIVWSPIAQGVLSGKYKPGEAPPSGSRATDEKGGADMISRFMKDDVLSRVQDLRPVADELDLTMAQLAIAWVLQNDNVAAALIGASRPEQVVENVKASGVRIPDELMKRIDEVLGTIVERDPAKTTATAPQERPT